MKNNYKHSAFEFFCDYFNYEDKERYWFNMSGGHRYNLSWGNLGKFEKNGLIKIHGTSMEDSLVLISFTDDGLIFKKFTHL